MKEQIEEMANIIFESSPIPSLWYSDAVRFAEALYSADYRKQIEGEWKPIMAICNRVECNKCGEMGVLRWKYCPNCGAKMKGATDERAG